MGWGVFYVSSTVQRLVATLLDRNGRFLLLVIGNESTFSVIINRRNIGNRCIIVLIDIFFTMILVKSMDGSPHTSELMKIIV